MIYKLSLDWRLDWSLRTCLSTAFAAFLALGIDTEGSIQFVFAAFVCVMVKDSTFGATLKNGIACITSTSCVSVLCSILIYCCRVVYSRPLFLFWTFLLCTVNQYIEQLKDIEDGDRMELLKMALKLPDTLKTEMEDFEEEEIQMLEALLRKAIDALNGFRSDEGKILQSEFNKTKNC